MSRNEQGAPGEYPEQVKSPTFEGFTPEMIIESIEEMGSNFPYHKLNEVPSELHPKIADLLISIGRGDLVLDNLDNFQNIDHKKIIDDIIKRGQTHFIRQDSIRHVKGITQKEIAEKVRPLLKDTRFKPHLKRKGILRPPLPEEPKETITRRLLRKLVKTPPPQETTVTDIEQILIGDGVDKRTIEEFDKPTIEVLHKLFGDHINWKNFFSQELCEKLGDSGNEIHHFELRQMQELHWRLKHIVFPSSPDDYSYSDDEIEALLLECSATNIVDFVKDFLEKGKQKIIEALTKHQSKYFEVSPESTIWRYGNVAEMSLEEYLEHCQDRSQSSGRLLVHVIKDHLYEKLLKNPHLTPAVLLHIKKDYDDVSNQLAANRNYNSDTGITKAFGLSVGTHFSFDDKVEYPQGRFACVFAAEALFNNYAYLERDKQSENDIVIGGLSNDYLDDPTHQVDIQRYGFFLVPSDYKEKLPDVPKGIRIFYYHGSLDHGLKQLRESIGQPSQKVNLARKLKFNRRLGEKHELSINTPFYAQTVIQRQLEMASKEARTGNNIFPSDDFTLQHIGKGGGKGNYFSV